MPELKTKCVCGCSGEPSRGMFLPGHDSIHAGNIRSHLREGRDLVARDLAELAGWVIVEGVLEKGPNFACGHPRVGNTRLQNRVCSTCWDGTK